MGDEVAIVSSKSRDRGAAARETRDWRQRWFDTNIEDAYGQINRFYDYFEGGNELHSLADLL